ncbi:MAG: hypothetical protein ACRD29_13360 [Acidimicrobiales bacterium]
MASVVALTTMASAYAWADGVSQFADDAVATTVDTETDDTLVAHGVVDGSGRRVVRTYTKVDDWGCSGDPGVALDTWGRVWVRTTDATTGERLQSYYYCGELPVGAPGAAPAPPLPPLPEEVWALIPLPQDEININPHVRGLVGVETWLWYDEGMSLDVPPASVRGWAVTTDVWVREICWDMGYDTDDRTQNDDLAADDEVCRDRAGTEDDPSATFVYSAQCNDCTVSMTVTWTGEYTVTRPLFPAGQMFPMGTETVSAERIYDVIEVEAVGSG